MLAISFVSILVILVSCSSVKIENHEWCVLAGQDGAFCFHTLNNSERDITKEEWDALSPGWIAGSPEAFANLKIAVEQLCKETKKCTYETQKRLQAFFEKTKRARGVEWPTVLELKPVTETEDELLLLGSE